MSREKLFSMELGYIQDNELRKSLNDSIKGLKIISDDFK